MRKNTILEICASTYAAALAAYQAGADRIELCSALTEGGLTPSQGLMAEVAKIPNLKKHILIRPRSGDFLYSGEELSIMKADIKVAKACGADGIVVGALHKDGSIDIESMRDLITCAEGMEVTFHRAFDMCRNPQQAIESIIKLGCRRILTSGQAPKADMALDHISNYIKQASGRIIIMPGCGINKDNIRKIIECTGATEVHASASKFHASRMAYKKFGVNMGTDEADEYGIVESDEKKIAEIIQAIPY